MENTYSSYRGGWRTHLAYIFLFLISIQCFVAFEFRANIREFFVDSFNFCFFAFAIANVRYEYGESPDPVPPNGWHFERNLGYLLGPCGGLHACQITRRTCRCSQVETAAAPPAARLTVLSAPLSVDARGLSTISISMYL